jgi:hypothetical protein
MHGNYNPDKDKESAQRLAHKQHNPDYEPNATGYFEHGPRSLFTGEAAGFVTKKVLSQWDYGKLQEGRIVPSPLKVVCMHRPEAQRRASLEEFDWGPGGLEKRLKFWPLWALWQKCHPGAEVTHVNYDQLVEDTHTVYRRLVEHGWPLEYPEAACATIDPKLYRHR